MKVKTYFLTTAFFNFFSHLQNFLKIGIYTHRLILVVTKNLKKNYRLEAEILAHKVGKYEKVTDD